MATTARRLPFFTFHHPEMQEVVLQAAVDAGSEVRRGVNVRNVKLGGVPTVTVEKDGRVEEIRARLIVGADQNYGFSHRQERRLSIQTAAG